MITKAQMKEHLLKCIEQIDKLDDTVEEVYFTLDEGHYTDPYCVRDVKINFEQVDNNVVGLVIETFKKY